MANKEQSIPDQLNIFQYKSYNSIPPAKLAWITMKANQQGKNPKMVHAGIKPIQESTGKNLSMNSMRQKRNLVIEGE